MLRGERPGVARRRVLEELSGLSLAGLEPRLYLSAEERARPPSPWLVADARPLVLMHARASQPCKHWPDRRWRALAAGLEARGCRVVEVGVGQAVLAERPSLVGRTSVRELAHALAHAAVLVGDDSGPLHLALAVGTRAVGVFGATRADLLYGADRRFTAVSSQAECHYCWSRWNLAYPSGHCPRPRHDCVEDVQVATVLAAVLAQLGRAMNRVALAVGRARPGPAARRWSATVNHRSRMPPTTIAWAGAWPRGTATSTHRASPPPLDPGLPGLLAVVYPRVVTAWWRRAWSGADRYRHGGRHRDTRFGAGRTGRGAHRRPARGTLPELRVVRLWVPARCSSRRCSRR